MTKSDPQGEIRKEWRAFLDPGVGTRPPNRLRDGVLSAVRSDLEPGTPRVLVKLGIVHLVTSLATLSICPQFGFRLFGEGMGMMHYFMGLGEYGCAVACGMFFLGASLLVAALIFTRAEWRQIRSWRWLALSALVLPSIGFFKFMNAEVFVELSFAWLFGALVCGWAMVEGVWRVKAAPSAA